MQIAYNQVDYTGWSEIVQGVTSKIFLKKKGYNNYFHYVYEVMREKFSTDLK